MLAGFGHRQSASQAEITLEVVLVEFFTRAPQQSQYTNNRADKPLALMLFYAVPHIVDKYLKRQPPTDMLVASES